MKTIFYVGAALMISAGIYGFVDYKKVSRSASFKKMYEEIKTPLTTPAAEVKPVSSKTISVKEEKKTEADDKKASASLLKSKQAKGTKKIHYKEFSRAALENGGEIIDPVKSRN